mmetsp:Transcript_119364/g.349288  ORF Transcript_119364/g.349288 Transcript_119364/m.349288 type:complete len:302 (+) Transcript_119364:871-1776(+)
MEELTSRSNRLRPGLHHRTGRGLRPGRRHRTEVLRRPGLPDALQVPLHQVPCRRVLVEYLLLGEELPHQLGFCRRCHGGCSALPRHAHHHSVLGRGGALQPVPAPHRQHPGGRGVRLHHLRLVPAHVACRQGGRRVGRDHGPRCGRHHLHTIVLRDSVHGLHVPVRSQVSVPSGAGGEGAGGLHGDPRLRQGADLLEQRGRRQDALAALGLGPPLPEAGGAQHPGGRHGCWHIKACRGQVTFHCLEPNHRGGQAQDRKSYLGCRPGSKSRPVLSVHISSGAEFSTPWQSQSAGGHCFFVGC